MAKLKVVEGKAKITVEEKLLRVIEAGVKEFKLAQALEKKFIAGKGPKPIPSPETSAAELGKYIASRWTKLATDNGIDFEAEKKEAEAKKAKEAEKIKAAKLKAAPEKKPVRGQKDYAPKAPANPAEV
jgi:hypothetical protein